MKKQTRIIFGLCALIVGAVVCFAALEYFGGISTQASSAASDQQVVCHEGESCK